jgi:hypothetical protein
LKKKNHYVNNPPGNTVTAEMVLKQADLYDKPSDQKNQSQRNRTMSKKTQMLVYLILLAIIDTFIPIPITTLILILVIIKRPQWFRNWIEEIYGA